MTSLRITSVPAIPDSRIVPDATVFRGDPPTGSSSPSGLPATACWRA
jgi:hypothetical protein